MRDKDHILDLTCGWGVFVSLVILTWTYLWIRSRRPRDFPPGPTPLPVIGNIPSLFGGDLLQTFTGLKEKYGSIYSLSIGSYWAVFVNDSKLLREVLVKHGDSFDNRPNDFVFKTLLEGKGISSSNGDVWKQKRTCTINALKQIGFGKRSMESKIIEEIKCFLQEIKDKKGEPVCIENTLRVTLSNIICSIVFGKRYSYSDQTFVKLIRDIHDVMTNPFIPVVNWMPFLHNMSKFWDVFGTQKSINLVKDLLDQMKKAIQEHKTTLDKEDPRDFIDAYQVELERHKTESTDNSPEGVLLDLFTSGTESTSTSILWAVLFLVCYPDVQKTLHDELETVVGTSNFQSLLDYKDKLPYCEAFMCETLRLGNIFPLSVPRTTTEDVVIGGYRIPNGAVVIPNLDSAMHDENIFKHSRAFDPRRFLNDDGTPNHRRHDFFPFSLGRRVCIGESMAKMELYLFITSIVSRYRIVPGDEEQPPTVQGKIGTTYSPLPYKVRFTEW